MKTPEQYIKPIEDMHPYKQRGNPDSYSQYNEGWTDACGAFYDVIEQVIYDVIEQVIADTQADTKDRLEAIERRSKEVDVVLDSLLKKLNRV